METPVAGREARDTEGSQRPVESAGFDGAGQSARRSLNCPACSRMTVHRFLYSKNDCEILRCEECGLGRTESDGFNPSAYYTADYFSGKRSDGYADYLGAESVLRQEFSRTVEFIRKFRDSGRLLEIGCAYGFLLDEAKRHFDVTGIELAEEAADHCRRSGLRVFAGAADERLLQGLGVFDVVIMLDVIEHLPVPHETIALLARHLKPGGIIVVTTGDFGALPARLAGARWRLMTPPQHLWFFSQESMRRMAASAGLKVEYIDHPWKTVPLSLISFQLARMIGFEPRAAGAWGKLGVPVNLFDAMRVVLRKEGP
jgi:SAM-dependent methyltransferase/predicted RNA-binding Zn-ribbon protein involved in translation (DUF1610 family)